MTIGATSSYLIPQEFEELRETIRAIPQHKHLGTKNDERTSRAGSANGPRYRFHVSESSLTAIGLATTRVRVSAACRVSQSPARLRHTAW